MPLTQIEQHFSLGFAEHAEHGHIVAIDGEGFRKRFHELRAETIDLPVRIKRVVEARLHVLPRLDKGADDILEHRDAHRLDWKSTRLHSRHSFASRLPFSA